MLKRMSLEGLDTPVISGDKMCVMNKDTPVIEFCWDDVSGEPPLVIKDNDAPKFITKDLEGWLRSRVNNRGLDRREHLVPPCKTGYLTTVGMLKRTHGVSLTDTLWVTGDTSISWSSVSPYRNLKPSEVGRISLTESSEPVPLEVAPEFATEGWLSKCWELDDATGDPLLFKAGTVGACNTGNEPEAEVMASQILEALGYPHVDYWIAEKYGRLCSVCRAFTSETISFLPLSKLTGGDSVATQDIFQLYRESRCLARCSRQRLSRYN